MVAVEVRSDEEGKAIAVIDCDYPPGREELQRARYTARMDASQ